VDQMTVKRASTMLTVDYPHEGWRFARVACKVLRQRCAQDHRDALMSQFRDRSHCVDLAPSGAAGAEAGPQRGTRR